MILQLKKKIGAAICLLTVTLLAVSNGVVGVQRFVDEPQNGTVFQGEMHMLRCAVQDRIGLVQWLRDGFGLGPGTEFEGYPRYRVLQNHDSGEFHLMITSIQLEDDAVFECQVGATSWNRGLQSRRAKLTVQVPPDTVSIEGSPLVNVISGQSHALVCHANNGKPAPSITWEKAGRTVIDGVHYTTTVQEDGKRVDATSRLVIIPTKTDQGKEFTCQATSPAMVYAMSAVVRLEVQYKPEVSMTVSNSQRIKEFEGVTFTCEAVANPLEVTWRWYIDAKEVPEQVSGVFYLRDVTRDLHKKKISCEATNSVGNTRQVFTLNVEYGPRFVSDAESHSADPGDSIFVTCNVDSNPEAAIIWRRKGSSRILGDQAALHIPMVTEDHFTTFTCTASVQDYKDVTKDIRILRRGPPKIVSDAEQFGEDGNAGFLECLVESVPKPSKVSWTKHGEVLDFDRLSRYRVREEDVANGRRSIVEVTDVEEKDFAEYTCSVQNSYGADQLTIKYSKKEVMPIAVIVAGVMTGVIVIIIVCVIVFFYLRKRKSKDSSDSNSRSSSDSASSKKLNNVPNIKVEYSTPSTIDGWKDSLPDYQFPRYSAEYDELRYPTKDISFPGATNYNTDCYGDYDISPRNRDPYFRPTICDNVYGTYPRGMANPFAPRADVTYGPLYGSETYATYGRPARRDFSPIGFIALPQPPSSPTESKLSTNV